ncbi:unnamed protein product [Paramecium pentaurelia]|uniref:Carboxypeptidase n=1 Tax=Paramecium pentaurelia TaxID=43138 RepID=A0A8S1S9X3_9CILI|nr:unnamed protein product [Paramecium pentaurelia]
MKQLLAIHLLICLSLASTAQDDLVKSDDLKEYTNGVFDFKGQMYSGYLKAIDDDKTYFHYYFMTSTFEDVFTQQNTPVMLWLNGGPGCSSLQGAVNENGPFVFKEGTAEFQENQWSWTKFAHMLYLESPAKVGYSYGDADVNDDTVAIQNLRALVDFFERFPEYQTKDFFIAGESYAGIYIPLLANQILKHNIEYPNNTINLKGIMIGNGCTHPTECSDVADIYPIHTIEYFARQGFLSEEQYKVAQHLQNSGKCSDLHNLHQECFDFLDQVVNQYYESPSVFLMNPYNIYGYCYNYKPDQYQLRKNDPMLKRFIPKNNKNDEEFGSCTDDKGMYVVFRDPKWKQITHIKPESPEWDVCTDDDEFIYEKFEQQSYYIYESLIKSKKIRIMHFSGDIDSVVPITGTLFWIQLLQNELQLSTTENWRAWYVPGDRTMDTQQNAGNVFSIEGLQFVTVRNAGHMVPTDRRKEAYWMVKYFILDQKLPDRQQSISVQ